MFGVEVCTTWSACSRSDLDWLGVFIMRNLTGASSTAGSNANARRF
jgi:hypothetical protein